MPIMRCLSFSTNMFYHNSIDIRIKTQHSMDACSDADVKADTKLNAWKYKFLSNLIVNEFMLI